MTSGKDRLMPEKAGSFKRNSAFTPALISVDKAYLDRIKHGEDHVESEGSSETYLNERDSLEDGQHPGNNEEQHNSK